MNRPIEIGLGERRRRQAKRETRHRGVQRAIGDVGERGRRIRIAPLDLLGRNYSANLRNETQRCLIGGRLHVSWSIRLRRSRNRHGAPILYASVLSERALNYEYVAKLLQRNDLDQSVI